MEDNIAFSGNLNFLNFGDLIQLIGSNGSTGVLRILSKYSEQPGSVYFINGNPVDALNGSIKGLDALYSLFGWIDGKFEFSDEPVECETEIKNSRMEIILEGLRLLDDGKIKKLTPVSYSDKSLAYSNDKKGSLPIIKGPFVDYMYVVNEEEYKDQEVIVKQGNYGNWIWVILDGIVEIRKETSKDYAPVVRIGNGSFIGSLACLFTKGHIRSTTVVAVGNVLLGVLDAQRLSKESSGISQDLRDLLLCLDKRLKQTTIRTASLYFNKKSIDDFLKAKDLIIKQGETTNEILKIEKGNAFVVRNTKKGNVVLAKLDKGDFFGNIPFLNLGHEPHSASVYASKDLETTGIDPKKIYKEYNQLSTTFKNMIENCSNCISSTTLQACEFQ